MIEVALSLLLILALPVMVAVCAALILWDLWHAGEGER